MKFSCLFEMKKFITRVFNTLKISYFICLIDLIDIMSIFLREKNWHKPINKNRGYVVFKKSVLFLMIFYVEVIYFSISFKQN